MNAAKGKIVLITGGLGGIGLELLKILLENGVKGISVLDLQCIQKENLLEEMSRNYPGKVLFIPADVTKSNELDVAFKKTINTFKNLDIVINSAGIIDEINWKHCINVNLIGNMEVSYLALEYMPKYSSGNEGILMNISSICGVSPLFCAPSYCATKHGLIGFGRSLHEGRLDEKFNIKILTLCPGFTDTNFIKNTHDKSSNKNHLMMFHKMLSSSSIQSPRYVAESCLKIMKIGNSGSGWLVIDDDMYEIDFKPLENLRKNNLPSSL